MRHPGVIVRRHLFGGPAVVEFYREPDGGLVAEVLVERGNELLKLTRKPLRVTGGAVREWVPRAAEERERRRRRRYARAAAGVRP